MATSRDNNVVCTENFRNLNLARVWDSLYRIYNEQEGIDEPNGVVCWEVYPSNDAVKI